MPIGKVWICLSFTVCVFLFVCLFVCVFACSYGYGLLTLQMCRSWNVVWRVDLGSTCVDRGPVSTDVLVCVYVSRTDCGRLFELFVRIECLGDTEPIISLIYPSTADDQVLTALMAALLLPIRMLY